MSIIETLVEKFPVRKSKQEKQDFRQWMIEQSAAMGYQAAADETGYSRNIVIGDPEHAQVIFTAHYDTPPVMPIPNFITPTNVWIYLLYQVGMSLCILAPGVLVFFILLSLISNWGIAYMSMMVTFFGLALLMMFGPANKHCVNDNTSGVAAVMELMQRLPQEQRSKAAFILFDNEEKGLLGSSSYAGKHKQVKKNKLLINMDCVGDGEHILFFTNKATRQLPEYPLLEKSMAKQQGRQLVMNWMEKCIYPSDHAAFKYGIAVCACNKSPRLGYYCDKIHTKHDTICNQENLDFITSGLADFVARL